MVETTNDNDFVLPEIITNPHPRRDIKSSVFADLFGKDEKYGKRNFLSLYNAIHGTNLKYEETHMELKNIEQAVYKTFDNDVGMLIDDRLIVLVEHQSTRNENMPMRFLEYISRLYSGMFPANLKYRRERVMFPSPEFIVVYGGDITGEVSDEMKLSDSFIVTEEEPALELRVKVLNALSKDLPMVKNCGILKEYMQFIKIMDAVKDRKDTSLYQSAIQFCIDNNILSEYLRGKVTEVIDMLFAEYNYEEDIRTQRQEAEEKGIAIGFSRGRTEVARNFIRAGTDFSIISQCTGLSMEELQEIKNSLEAN